MKTTETLITEIIEREGGYVNDPDDPGGATKYGITIGTLGGWRGKKVTPNDVRKLSKDVARIIYRQNYLIKPKIDKLPAQLMPAVMDMYVNAGSNGIKILQRVLNESGAKLKVDGAIGDKTINAAKFAITTYGSAIVVDGYGAARRNYYYDLADRRVASRKYANTRAGNKGGWIKRAEEFMSPGRHYSLDQHKARTERWIPRVSVDPLGYQNVLPRLAPPNIGPVVNLRPRMANPTAQKRLPWYIRIWRAMTGGVT